MKFLVCLAVKCFQFGFPRIDVSSNGEHKLSRVLAAFRLADEEILLPRIDYLCDRDRVKSASPVRIGLRGAAGYSPIELAEIDLIVHSMSSQR